MDKKNLKRQLTQFVNGAALISCSQLERFLGFGHNKTMGILSGLDAIEVSERRKYFVSDVADRLMEYKIIT